MWRNSFSHTGTLRGYGIVINYSNIVYIGKATYPAIYGLEASRKEARRLTKRASDALGVFGKKGEVLRGIADYLLDRDY